MVRVVWADRRHHLIASSQVQPGFTSVELRASLAATPMFASLAAYGLGTLATKSRLGALTAVAGVAAIAVAGVRVWLLWLGVV